MKGRLGLTLGDSKSKACKSKKYSILTSQTCLGNIDIQDILLLLRAQSFANNTHKRLFKYQGEELKMLVRKEMNGERNYNRATKQNII